METTRLLGSFYKLIGGTPIYAPFMGPPKKVPKIFGNPIWVLGSGASWHGHVHKHFVSQLKVVEKAAERQRRNTAAVLD